MMDYKGRFRIFDTRRIRTYSIDDRPSKVLAGDLSAPEEILNRPPDFESPDLDAVAKAAREARAAGRPVVLFTGAHLIKNGFGPLMLDLIRRGMLTLVGMNAAGMIHDLELALRGRTSEDVPRALPLGEFGFARETGDLINRALTSGEAMKIGAGESLARLILGEAMPELAEFPHRELSLTAGAYEAGVPVTMHASIGCDIVDMHDSWDPAAKGGCSGRDFGIFCAEIERMAEGGGVFINVGSAVTGPEVFLKACSMCANVGKPPRGLTTASFDIRPGSTADVRDERKAGYYYRDIKSVVSRIPESFGGRGYYVQGDHLKTLPALYHALVRSS